MSLLYQEIERILFHGIHHGSTVAQNNQTVLLPRANLCHSCRKSFTGNCCSPGLLQRELKCCRWNSCHTVMSVKNLQTQTKLLTFITLPLQPKQHLVFSYWNKNVSAVMMLRVLSKHFLACSTNLSQRKLHKVHTIKYLMECINDDIHTLCYFCSTLVANVF